MLVAATARRRVAATQAATTKRASLRRLRRADRVPRCLAAEGVDLADRVAASLVVAVGVLVREAAVARFWRAAGRIGANSFAGGIHARGRGAEGVPRAGAAEDVDEADRFAANEIVAPRRWVGLAAVAGADIAALELVAATAVGGVGELNAGRVPLGGAAEIVDQTHAVAASAIRARGLQMGDVAAIAADVTAAGEVDLAGGARFGGAGVVPRDGAAVLEARVAANGLAAISDGAARGVVGVEAIAARRLAASAHAGGTGGEHAGGIPAHFAAVWLEAADRFAASGVVAVGREMRAQAFARAVVAATRRAATDDARHGGAARVPAFGAAERINVANARAANFVFAASGFSVFLEATSRARALPSGERLAEVAGGAHADAVPLHIAAKRVGFADNRAAGGVGAAWSEVDDIAGAVARATAEAPADPLGDGHAAFAPAEGAADWIDRANCGAAFRIGAAVGSVHSERRAGAGATSW